MDKDSSGRDDRSYFWEECYMRRYMKDFLYNEDGTEIIEWLAILAVASVLVAVVVAIGEKAKGTLNAAAGYL